MTTTLESPTTTGQVLLRGVRWATYEALRAEVESHRVRLTFDRGALEIMTPSHAHETYKRLMGRLIETMTDELSIQIKSGGSTTLRAILRERGLEPDECYWVENEERMRGVRDLDLARDPPPDLAVEIEVSQSALDRLGIYASLGVREVWRFTSKAQLVCHLLGSDGAYAESATSGRFPFLKPAELVAFLLDSSKTGETTWIRTFRQWVRREVAVRPGAPRTKPSDV